MATDPGPGSSHPAELPRPLPAGLRAEVVRGRRTVLARAPELRALAQASGQAGELADLGFYLQVPTRVRYLPTLVLLYAGEPTAAVLLPVAAVLLYDAWFLLGPGRFFTGNDLRGRRTVFAPPGQRVEAAAVAAQSLLERGAKFVNIDVDLGPMPSGEDAEASALGKARALVHLKLPGLVGRPVDWALVSGIKRFDLALGPDFESTLQAFGRRTRKNMKIYPRLCETELGARFVANPRIGREAFLAMNEAVSYPASRKVASWRFDALARFPNLFLYGLQAADGTWLSLLCGHRREREVVIDWQMNRRGFERYSLSTAMRALLLRHEIAQGSTSLTVQGGTPHPMGSSFRFHAVYNLAVRRRGSVLLRAAASLLGRWAEGKLVTSALLKPWRTWVPCWRSQRAPESMAPDR